MGIVLNGLLGGFSGKVGPVIGCRYKGKTYLRSLPGKRKGPPTEAQLAQQVKFGMMGAFNADMHELFRHTFDYVGNSLLKSKIAFGQNLKYAVMGEYPDFYIDFSRVILSKGLLDNVGVISAAVKGGKIRLKWYDNNGVGLTRNDDEVILVAYCPETRETLFRIGTSLREDEVAVLDVSAYKGQTLHTWIIFRSRNLKYISSTAYTGVFVVV
jgi:hypothetical protein